MNLNGTFNGRVPLGIRGVLSVSNESTVGLSSGVAILIDGVPVPSDSLAGNQLNNDIRDIEVLRGPQVTLGGRTAATGVINIVTRQPSDTLTGDLSVIGTTDAENRVSPLLAGPVAQALEFKYSRLRQRSASSHQEYSARSLGPRSGYTGPRQSFSSSRTRILM